MLIADQVARITEEVDEVLRKDFNKQLFRVKEQDQIRLLKLRVWSIRYKVTIAYILAKLVTRYSKIAKKYHNGRSDKGIGVTIPVLTGQAAEEYLKECIAKDFPEKENEIAWRQSEQDKMLAIVIDDEKRPKNILKYKSVAAFRRAYEKRIRLQEVKTSKITKQIAKQPFRNNPFR